jgi:hypothetical protein
MQLHDDQISRFPLEQPFLCEGLKRNEKRADEGGFIVQTSLDLDGLVAPFLPFWLRITAPCIVQVIHGAVQEFTPGARKVAEPSYPSSALPLFLIILLNNDRH